MNTLGLYLLVVVRVGLSWLFAGTLGLSQFIFVFLFSWIAFVTLGLDWFVFGLMYLGLSWFVLV